MATLDEVKAVVDTILAALTIYPELGAWGTPADYSVLVRQDQPVGSGTSQYKVEDVPLAEQRLLGRITGGDVAALTAAQVKTLLAIVEADISDLDHTDTTAIHDNVSAEISALAEKVTPVNGDHLLIEDSAASNAKRRVQVGNLPGGGETNTASNVGTAGVGVFKQKTGVDLEFKKVNAGSSKITVTDDVANNEVDIDVAVANIDHDALTNFVADEHLPSSTFATAAQGTTADSALQNVVEDTTPQLGGNLDLNGSDLYDANGNEQLTFQSNTSAVNHCKIRNAATGTSPVIYAIGDDANINLGLIGKGTGVVTSISPFYVTGDITLTGTVDGRDVATDGTKLDGIATNANNYSHPNHTGDVTSTGDGATAIAAGVVGKTELEAAYQTRAGVIYIADPVAGDAVPNILLPDAVSFVRIRVQCDAGTVTCNLEHRVKTAPFAAGTDIVSADIVGDTTGVEKTAGDFASSGAVTADRHLYATVTSVTGSPTEVKIDFEYTVD